jgi:hypothetical protein
VPNRSGSGSESWCACAKLTITANGDEVTRTMPMSIFTRSAGVHQRRSTSPLTDLSRIRVLVFDLVLNIGPREGSGDAELGSVSGATYLGGPTLATPPQIRPLVDCLDPRAVGVWHRDRVLALRGRA